MRSFDPRLSQLSWRIVCFVYFQHYSLISTTLLPQYQDTVTAMTEVMYDGYAKGNFPADEDHLRWAQLQTGVSLCYLTLMLMV